MTVVACLPMHLREVVLCQVAHGPGVQAPVGGEVVEGAEAAGRPRQELFQDEDILQTLKINLFFLLLLLQCGNPTNIASVKLVMGCSKVRFFSLF